MNSKKLMTTLELAEKILRETRKPLTPEEIWDVAKGKGYDKKSTLKGKTPWRTIGALLYVDIRDNPESMFIKTGIRPRRFYLREHAGELKGLTISDEPTKKKVKPEYTESDLHPFLTYLAFTKLSAHTKTIRHSGSKRHKKGQTEWLHPDVIGFYSPIEDWEQEVLEFTMEVDRPSIKLYSFELKRELNFANLREAFFQTVSNSSWANEGYLVAAEIRDELEFRDELKRLSNSFGIGVIQIDITDPDSSSIILPAETKENIDMDTVNRLTYENKDFKSFLVRIVKDVNIREFRKEMYDEVFETGDEVLKDFKRKIKKRKK